MTNSKNLLSSVCAISLIAASPALSDPESTKILEEYFDILKSAPITLEVGDKEDADDYTQWNNITLKSNDGGIQYAIPWLKVSKKILGDHDLTISEKIDGVFQSPDPNVLDPVKFAVENKNMVVTISGEEGARQYDSTFSEMTFHTIDSALLDISFKMTGGTSTQLLKTGDMGASSGSFDIKEMVIAYALEVEGQPMSFTSTMQDLTAEFEIPLYTDFDPENPTAFFDATRNMGISYNIGPSTSKLDMVSPMGPIVVNGTVGASSGTFGIADSMATIAGKTDSLKYEFLATAAGFPPMQISISDAVVNIGLPLDNVTESKQANYKIAINGLAISEAIWMMFDPKSLLPRDEISLDIDLLAGMRWVKKISKFDVKNPGNAPPIEVDNAEIKALNIKIAGAKLQTNGSVMIDNSQFPPVPDGTVNISLKGGYGLLGKLTELGLVPEQNAMMIQGMAAMFFKPGAGGDDDLVSTITMTKDGNISANGMPLK